MAEKRDAVRLKADPTYEEIEREIAQALAVEPSPEFLARVRMRVANEPPPRRAWARWMPVLVGATAVAAAVAIAIVAPWRGSQVQLKKAPQADTQVRLKPDPTEKIVASATSTVASATSTVPSATSTAVASPTATAVASPTATAVASPTSTAVASGLSRTKTSTPQVLIAQDEAEALRRLFARSAERGIQIPPDVIAGVTTAETDLLPPEIAISPIRIDPLIPLVNGEEGVRQ
jgi:hypothetical protein